MPRLFLSVPIPDAIRQSIHPLQQGIDGAVWNPLDNMHITLRFLGDVGPECIEPLQRRLAEKNHADSPSLALSSVGAFSSVDGTPAVLWAGVKNGSELQKLKSSIDQHLEGIPLPPETHAEYVPHVTLARLTGNTEQVKNYLAQHEKFQTPMFTVDSFLLLESSGKPGVPHKVLRKYPVGATQNTLGPKPPRSP